MRIVALSAKHSMKKKSRLEAWRIEISTDSREEPAAQPDASSGAKHLPRRDSSWSNVHGAMLKCF